MLRDESNEVEFKFDGLPDDCHAEIQQWLDARPLTDEDIDAMWAREQEERETANVDPVCELNTRRILELKARFEAMEPTTDDRERLIG